MNRPLLHEPNSVSMLMLEPMAINFISVYNMDMGSYRLFIRHHKNYNGQSPYKRGYRGTYVTKIPILRVGQKNW